jgi:2-polyprenyl-3-methyl-5-hydroxy-6-metoxy-1,4-benzoquinol methylase
MPTNITTTAVVQESEEFWDRFTASAALHPANLYRYTLISDIIHAWKGPKDRIVDLGCGNGVLLEHLHRRGIGRDLVGFDGSMAITQRNRQRRPFAEFDQADLQLPGKFPLQGLADVVVCSEVVEHMPVYAPVFQIAYNSLRSGGLFILTTQGGKRRRHDVELLGHLRHYDINALANEVAAAGFTVTKRQQAGWPALTVQKIAASLFMGRVEQELASTKEPSALFKFACKVIGIGLKLSSKRFGPQLVIAAQKP